jgi:hypothetical protein
MPPSNRPFSQRVQEILSAINPGTAFLLMIFSALIAFEMFNYTTTDHALQDLLGSLQFTGMRWSTILAFAFCGIDFAGIARLFTPEQGLDEPKEVWYLFGAWLLAATMNAILTWWGVSMAITNHPVQSAAVVDPKTIATVVPVFVAVMVWVIRILIIGTLSNALDRTLHTGARRSNNLRRSPSAQPSFSQPAASTSFAPSASAGLSPRASLNRSAAPTPTAEARQTQYASRDSGRDANRAQAQQPVEASHGFPEPTYHSLSMKGSASNPTPSTGTSSSYNSTRTTGNGPSTPMRKL